MFRVLTFNLWHGLSPSGHLQFEELEPEFRRAQRWEAQERLLFSESGLPEFDVAFLQEVNPLGLRVSRWVETFPLRATSQLDSAGLKLFGMGPPFNLQSGLVTLSHSRWLGQSLKPLRLSGQARIWGGTALQWAESRWATFQETMHPQWGRLLLVNVHLHHGLQWDRELAELLENWSLPRLKQILRLGTQKRLGELNRLLTYLEQLESAYNLIVMGGDFNATPDTEEIGMVKACGFVDAWEHWGSGEEGLTFDAQKNLANHRLLGHFVPAWVAELEGFQGLSSKDKQLLRHELLRLESRPRRIDYLFVKVLSEGLKLPEAKIEMLGQRAQGGIMASDHFGLQLEMNL